MSIKKHRESCASGLSERLRIARKAAGLTQQETARLGGVSVQSWRDYEAGRAEPKICTLIFMAEKNISLSWLVTGEEPMRLGEATAPQEQQEKSTGLIEEWVQEVRTRDGNDGRIVMELSLQVPEFRDWYKEKKRKSGGTEAGSAQENVA